MHKFPGILENMVTSLSKKQKEKKKEENKI